MEEILKWQCFSNNEARKASHQLQQIGHVRLGSSILVHLVHPSHRNAVCNVMGQLRAYTVSTISEYDLKQLWDNRKICLTIPYYYDKLM